MTGQRGTAMVFVLSALLLVSMGGAIFGAPVTLPLMYLGVRRHPTPLYRAIAGLLSALTFGEVVWAGVYVWIGEAEPWIWALPFLGASAVIVGYVRLSPKGAPNSVVPSASS